MKIIGKTAGGYLIEASASEIAHVAGVAAPAQVEGAKQTNGSYGYEWIYPIGTEVAVSERFYLMRKLEEGRNSAIQSAASFRAFADLLEQSIPEGLKLPPPPAEKDH